MTTRPRSLGAIARVATALLGLAVVPVTAFAQRVPIRDLVVDDQGVPLRLVGYGIVTGLAGTGDIAYSGRNSQHTVQSVANLLRRFDIIVPPELLRTRNVAAVLVTAEVSPWLRPGGRFDVHVSSVGDARSLRDGVLWMTPLVSEVGGTAMATAQGALLIEESDIIRRRVGWTGASGRIVGGGVVEGDLPRPAFTAASRLILKSPDIGIAARIASTIDSLIGKDIAKVEDPGAITLTLPDSGGGPAMALDRIRNLTVELQRVARIVIDQRTGTVVAGGDLTLGPGLVSVGGLALTIGGVPVDTIAVAGANPAPLRMPTGATVQQLAAALHAVRTPPQLIAQVFEALRAVGALSAEVVAR